MPINYALIDQLCTVLEDKLPDELWDFGKIVADVRTDDDSVMLNSLATLDPRCGTVGCALGALFAVVLHEDPYGEYYERAAEVLGIPEDHCELLFGNSPFDVKAVYGTYKHSQVTRHDVAAALRRYVDEGPWWRED